MSLFGASIASATPKLTFEQHQFEISAFEPDAKVNAASTPLLMSLPPVNGFAPNVNVMIQIFDGGIDKYAELTRSQFEAMKFKVLKDSKTEAGDWIAEYHGSIQQRHLYWYSRAVFRDGKVYFVTATAPKNEWQALGEKMRKVVESFSLTR